ncbi:phosphoribosyl-AMP cyclohydrolase [Sphingorhabdus sp. Alg239-R122]|uniref:phosphoribosyl-AMP cyclohydrolase n=1 Tax=Sphingorhabdus sp. Alg239-R122 TaxID=2305989 RepID=UPI0013DD6DE4|nr:phosphoribosyl-AMP cyclohydrolase [Sphingorhabdus sp. Alg239-R122]
MDKERETGLMLDPKYDASGLVTVAVTDSHSKDVLMIGHMNAEALRKTVTSDIVHFFSRSRQKLWMKGETSGNLLHVVDMRVDCDQDALWIVAKPAGPTCHTGASSCFYRRVKKDGLEHI